LIPDEWSDSANRTNPEFVFNKSIFLLLLFLSITAAASHFIQGREDIIPERKAFLNFPLQLGKWQGRNDYLGQAYLDGLKLTDYVIINYIQPEFGSSINFYSAYYQSQRKGVSVHSPKGCIPGDGWQITQFGQRDIPDITLDGNALQVNRAVIAKGDSRQLVYYWFQQRGRTITNEYLVKWYLFFDAITMNRTDGSLIRLVTPVEKTEDMDVADQRLQSFLKDLIPVVPAYLPGKSVAEHA
jgi:EpsI family protein